MFVLFLKTVKTLSVLTMSDQQNFVRTSKIFSFYLELYKYIHENDLDQ